MELSTSNLHRESLEESNRFAASFRRPHHIVGIEPHGEIVFSYNAATYHPSTEANPPLPSDSQLAVADSFCKSFSEGLSEHFNKWMLKFWSVSKYEADKDILDIATIQQHYGFHEFAFIPELTGDPKKAIVLGSCWMSWVDVGGEFILRIKSDQIECLGIFSTVGLSSNQWSNIHLDAIEEHFHTGMYRQWGKKAPEYEPFSRI